MDIKNSDFENMFESVKKSLIQRTSPLTLIFDGGWAHIKIAVEVMKRL